MDLGGFVVFLLMMPVLAAIGVTTLAAFVSMTVLGLLTDMSFKRLFFVSFFMGLAAPLLLGAAIASSFEDGTFERDLRDGIEELTDIRMENGQPLGGTLGELQKIGRDVEQGELSEQEAEERIRELFVGPEADAPAQIEQGTADDAEVSIDIEGVQITNDGDSLRIQID
ncbi:MAG: hypothetical protein AAF291_04895 [Pseudomonadota bacterium]